jgi:hypothetical protein
VRTLDLAPGYVEHAGRFWLTSLEREENKEMGRRGGEENKEKWCNVFHPFTLVATLSTGCSRLAVPGGVKSWLLCVCWPQLISFKLDSASLIARV